MQIHQLRPTYKKKQKKRVGRGGKRGTYSGRGMKGQKSRAGHRKAPVIRELIKKYPKLRGYKFKAREKKIAVVNIGILDKNFKDSETVSPKSLLEKGLIRKIKGKMPKVKILGDGETKKKLVIRDCETSEGAKRAVEKVGGNIATKYERSTKLRKG